MYHIVLLITIQEQEIYNFVKKHLQEVRKGAGDREGRPYGEAGTGGVEPRPYGGVTRSAVNGPSGTPAPTEGLQGVRQSGRPQGSPLQRSGNGRGRTPPLRRGYMKCLRAGRCGERTERCQWQKQRSERVAAVKILSDSRKAAQKFWAPQQGHRPLRKRSKNFGKRAAGDAAPYGGLQEVR